MEAVFIAIIIVFGLIAVYRVKNASQEAEVHRQQGLEFLAQNAKQDGVQTTASGLQYICLQAPEDESASKPESVKTKVVVHYQGSLINGSVFDSSYKRGEPLNFRLNQVIKGWQEGLQIMPVGSKYRFFIPENLAYGNRRAGSIPPGSTLIFDVELLSIEA